MQHLIPSFILLLYTKNIALLAQTLALLIDCLTILIKFVVRWLRCSRHLSTLPPSTPSAVLRLTRALSVLTSLPSDCGRSSGISKLVVPT